jgi:hypothetical protein
MCLFSKTVHRRTRQAKSGQGTSDVAALDLRKLLNMKDLSRHRSWSFTCSNGTYMVATCPAPVREEV